MSFHIKPYFLVRIAIAGVAVMFFAITPVFNIRQADAAIPQTINYQSRLLTPGGLAVTSTTAIQLSFYLHPTNGAPGDAPAQAGPLVWKEVYDQGSGACSMITPDAKGYFFLKLGSCTPFPAYLDFSEVMYVGVKIGADAEASPRVQLSSHPYALNAYRLNGFEATSTATANQLLALDSNLNFNIATGTFTGAGLFINGTSTLQQVTFSVATGTSLNLTQYLAIGAIRLDAIGTNNQTSGAYLVGVFDEFTNSNATTVQAALFDLDTAITTVSSTLYAMDLQQVTDNGNTTTNRIQFAGATSVGDIIPGAHDTYTLGNSDLRWSELWSGIVHVGTSTWDLAQADNGAFTIGQNGGSEILRILTNGAVGINNTNPQYDLEVAGVIRAWGQLVMGRSNLLPMIGVEPGAMLFRSLDSTAHIWDGTQWDQIITFDDLDFGWNLIGNTGTDPNINFLGTIDTQPLVFRTDNLERMRLDEVGRLGLGTSAPSSLLHLQGGLSDHALLTIDSDDGSGAGNDAGIIINSDNINGSDNPYIVFLNNGVYSTKLSGGIDNFSIWMPTSTSEFQIASGFTTKLFMNGLGNFGFFTETPAYRVDVVGDARVSAQLMIGQYAVNPALGNQAGAMIYNTTDLVPYYWDGTQWVAFATGTLAELDTLQTVTDRGASTTNPIIFAGGTSTASLEVTGELSINGIRLSASGTNPLVSGAYLVGTFDEFANFNATTVQAALKAIDAMLTFGSASTSVFVGLTASAYDGAFNYGGKVGYQAANDICLNEYPGSHFCRTDEIIATIAAVDISTLFAATTYGWIAEGPPGYTANSNDCAGYTSNSNTSLGAFWAYDPNGGGMGWLNNCQVTRKISCCR
ncbi:MAG: hypothetical protein BWY14_00170 [Parcubacteria group bacterium ADurb.Bin192]|nr:MAG: hypothetical protein BWY14_00170 [Parcubacteria group bacterium ADurb.Bin192]